MPDEQSQYLGIQSLGSLCLSVKQHGQNKHLLNIWEYLGKSCLLLSLRQQHHRDISHLYGLLTFVCCFVADWDALCNTATVSFMCAGIGQCLRAWCLSPHRHWAPQNTAMQPHSCSDRFVFLTDIFKRVFAADAKYLENHEKMNQSFWESLVKCLATTDPPLLNTEEKNNVSYQGNTYACYSTFLLHSGENIQSHYLIYWNILKGVTGHLDKWGSGHCFLLHCSPCAKTTGSV